MFNNLLTKIKTSFTERQEAVAKTFADLVNDVIDAERSGLSETIDGDVVAQRLIELDKSHGDFEAAVEHLTVYREYSELADAAEWSPRFAAMSLHEPADLIRERSAEFMQCIAKLKAVVKRPAAEVELNALKTRLSQKKEAWENAEKAYLETRKELEDPIAQAQNRVSQCDLAADALKKLHAAPTRRELELRKRREQLNDASLLGNEHNRANIQAMIAQLDEDIEAERGSKTSWKDQYLATQSRYVSLVAAAGLSRRIKGLTLPEPDDVIRERTELLRQCITELRQICKRDEAETRLREAESQRLEMRVGRQSSTTHPSILAAQLDQQIEQAKQEIARCEAASERLEKLAARVTEHEPAGE